MESAYVVKERIDEGTVYHVAPQTGANKVR